MRRKDRFKQVSKAGRESGGQKTAGRTREAGRRARAEAEARRAAGSPPATRPKETGGAGGPEPTRYGDWERKGLISDF